MVQLNFRFHMSVDDYVVYVVDAQPHRLNRWEFVKVSGMLQL